MALEALLAHLTEEEYFQQRTKQSYRTGQATVTPVTNFKLFCTDTMNTELPAILDELRSISDPIEQINKCLVVVQKFINWLALPHTNLFMPRNDGKSLLRCKAKDPQTIKIYISQLRLYLRKVGGIRITSEDVSDFVSYPEPLEKDEVEPLLPSEFKKICKRAGHRRALLYRIKKDCMARIGAMVQLRVKNINTDVRPIEITFPKHIMKKKNGISYTNVKYVIKEDEADLLDWLKQFKDPEDLVFTTSKNFVTALSNEEQYWSRLMYKIGFSEKYSNGQLKKTIHTIKSLSFTAACEAVNETYANAYGDHSRYTKNYLRWTKEEKIAKFRLFEKKISFFSKFELVTDTQLEDENSKLKLENEAKDELLSKFAEKTKDETKQTPKEALKKLMLEVLQENNLL